MTMADVKITKSQDGQEIVVESNKTEKPMKVCKSQGGFKFYKIVYEGGGPVPQEISGNFTGSSGALKALLLHLEGKKPTPNKAVNIRSKERKAEKDKLNGTKPVAENG